ncbi:endonuclease MutS2 [uncultured Tyzzerella sp.]|uniref:endonuclease MutS2 n=1 Tax=uncultured Tyzzerella sp. TaxID=2321398 RepID=UPI002941DDC0|nr:endonuclease MutS2 [uncultured Tyzzerella sp.]
MNEKALKTLEFDKIIEKIASFASSFVGKEKVRALKPSDDIKEIKIWQKETSQAVSMILKKGSLKIGGLRDINPFLQRTAVGGSLNFEELLNVADFLSACKRAKDYAKSENKYDVYDALEPKFEVIEPIESLDKEITRCIISNTEMSDDASQKLREIRRDIKIANERVRLELNKIIQSSTYKNMLQDPVITVKSDRYCIPVKAEYKNSFSGMVHDQSATGATVFMEPTSVVMLNNKIKELHSDELQEINRILKKLSEMVNEHRDILLSNLVVLTEIDFIFAKGEYSISINGTEPIFNEKGYINIKKARHPLLDNNNVVSTDIYLGDEFTTLLITGPNTGGKTVSLKTIGLFTLMGQAGLHISAFDNSELAVFDNVFSDIGDEQSIEQSLSTFSAHMTNIVSILDEVTDNSLVLLDELGAGTDPTEGACLAMSIIQYLHDRQIRTAVTTHYSELKVFAISTKGISNASCEFDVKTLRPTYRLLIGVPGKSNAFAISKRLGLPDYIIEDAKNMLSKEDTKFEDVITDLEINKKSLMIEKERAESYRLEAEKLKKDVENQKKKTREQKEKILLKATEDAKRILAKAKIDADNAVKEIQRLAKEKASQNDINSQRQKLKDKLSKLDERIDKFNNKNSQKRVIPKNLKKGDRVFIHSLNQSGTVTSEPNQKGEVMVMAGIMNIKTNLKDLSIDTTYVEPKKEHIKPKKTSSFKNNKAQTISYEIDLRGLYVDEAIEKVDKFIDDAFLAGMDTISVIHGKGTGALRTGIHEYLRRHSRVKKYRLGEFGEGDAGVTIVELK